MLSVLSLREMKIKTALRFYLTPVIIASIKKTNAVRMLGKRGAYTLMGVQPQWKSVCKFFKTVRMEPTIWS
jgi:hypothetical protein